MVSENTDNHETAFTVSIDHVSTTTGISAAERSITALQMRGRRRQARRISAAPATCSPCLPSTNGVLERNGHTEATVDLMRHGRA